MAISKFRAASLLLTYLRDAPIEDLRELAKVCAVEGEDDERTRFLMMHAAQKILSRGKQKNINDTFPMLLTRDLNEKSCDMQCHVGSFSVSQLPDLADSFIQQGDRRGQRQELYLVEVVERRQYVNRDLIGRRIYETEAEKDLT